VWSGKPYHAARKNPKNSKWFRRETVRLCRNNRDSWKVSMSINKQEDVGVYLALACSLREDFSSIVWMPLGHSTTTTTTTTLLKIAKTKGKEWSRKRWPRTHTPWQRGAPRAPTTAQARHRPRPLQAVAGVAGEGQGVADAEAGARVAAELRRAGVFAGLQVVFWRGAGGVRGKREREFATETAIYHLHSENRVKCWAWL